MVNAPKPVLNYTHFKYKIESFCFFHYGTSVPVLNS